MDYEYRILLLEKELTHLREMKDLAGRRMDAQDDRATAAIDLIHATTEKLKETVEHLNTLTLHVETLSVKVDALVSALLRDHPNGRGNGEGGAK